MPLTSSHEFREMAKRNCPTSDSILSSTRSAAKTLSMVCRHSAAMSGILVLIFACHIGLFYAAFYLASTASTDIAIISVIFIIYDMYPFAGLG